MKKTYFNHDSSARHDYRIMKMRAKLGMASYGIFWSLLELLFSEENKICIDDYNILAFGLQCDPKILKQVIEDFDLFVIEDGCFYSRRLNRQIEDINNKSNKAKESVNKRWSNTNVIQTHNDRNTSIVEYSKSKVKKSIENRIEAFKNAIHKIEDISTDDKNDFFLYWSELNKSSHNPKMRWELEKTWSLNLRIKRWERMNTGFNKQKKKFPDYYDELFDRRIDQSTRKEYHDHLKKLGFITTYNPNSGTKWIKK